MAWWLGALGKVAEKATDWIPGRKENYRNQEENLKRKLDEIQKRNPFTNADSLDYQRVADKLRIVQQKLKNT